jgi:7-carboxy-7-deazaguanine synthase (Cx14CxxC type)
VFLRFSGCNLWSGKKGDRPTSQCAFCDTDFVGTDGPSGGQYDPTDLAEAALAHWRGTAPPFVVCTGGEPLLQLEHLLLEKLHSKGCTVAVETNGTLPAPLDADWITVSPKAGTELRQTSGDELKLVYPQQGLDPTQFEDCRFSHFFLQPRVGPGCPDSLAECIEYCLAHPKWRLSVQLHKIVGIK